MPRIEPLTPPYPPQIDHALRRWMPPGVDHEPLALFRVLHHNPALASRMFALGAGLLGHGLLADLDREIVIARTTALSGCAYEWGVHASVFADRVGLTPEQLRATTTDEPTAGASWQPQHEVLLAAVDELHDTARLSTPAWKSLRTHYEEPQLLELLVLTGWYRTISYLANGLLLDEEPWATPFPHHGVMTDDLSPGSPAPALAPAPTVQRLDRYTKDESARILGDGADPFGVADTGLTWLPKEEHFGLVQADGRLVAHAGLRRLPLSVGGLDAEVVGVGGVAVAADVRGQGLARRVVGAALERARTMGPERALLFCRPPLVALYEKLGWRAVDGEVHVEQPEGRVVVMPLRTMWTPLHGDEGWPEGAARLRSLPM